MVARLISGNEAVAWGALRAGVRVATGYPGTPSTGCLASMLEMKLPDRYVEWSVNEKVALEVAAGVAWAGQRALCTMKMSGVNVAYDSLCSIAYSGTNGGLVIYVADDSGASAGMVEQDSRGFARLTDLPMLEPSTVADAYRLAQAAFELSERTGAPVFLRLVGSIANSYAPVEVESPLPPPERPVVLARDNAKYTKAGAAITLAQHRAAIARLEEAGRVIRELELNDLYLAPRDPGMHGDAGRAIRQPDIVEARQNGFASREWFSLPGVADLFQRIQDALSPLVQIQQSLPRPVQDTLRHAQQLIHEAHVLPLRQAQEVLRQAEAGLEQVEQAVPQAEQPVHLLQQLIGEVQGLLPPAERVDAQGATPPAPQADVAKAAGEPVSEAEPHPLRRAGLGIVAAGVTAAYLEEGIRLVARLGSEHWPDFGPDHVSVLRIASVHPLPSIEVQALFRHCDTILVLEELEPFVEQDIYVEARRQEFEGQIFGKLNGFFGRVGEYGVREVARGVAAALDLELPDDGPTSAGEAEALAALRPITVCAGCPHRGTFMALNQALRKLRYRADDVMVTGDIGCTILGMNPPFNAVWNEIAMGASIPLAQGYVHGGVTTPVVATIGDSTFFHAGIPGLINAVQHQVPLTLIIMDNGWTAMTGMQVNPGTAEPFQPAAGRPADIARIVPALGVDQFFAIDPFDLNGAAATLQRALTLPGVKVVLSRRECAIQAMRRGERAGAMHVVAEKCNVCKLCISLTGCPALSLAGDTVAIDPALCFGCGLCVETCNRDAILKEAVA